MPESARGRVHFFWIIVVALFSGQNSRKSLSAGECGRKPWFDHGCTSEYEVYLHFFHQTLQQVSAWRLLKKPQLGGCNFPHRGGQNYTKPLARLAQIQQSTDFTMYFRCISLLWDLVNGCKSRSSPNIFTLLDLQSVF